MPVYNCERYLGEAIESILGQTFHDLELIIVADKSTDRTDAILEFYRLKDPRIRVVYQEGSGLVPALNQGCRLARGKYIARMDADDRSLPQRLEKQVHYLEGHPDIGILGTWIMYIDAAGRLRKVARSFTDPRIIKWYLYFENCISHPTVMMRMDIIRNLGFYYQEALPAEDYDLWVRAAEVTQISVLGEALVEYRIWDGCASSLNSLPRNRAVIRIRQKMVSKLLGYAPSDEVITPIDIANSPVFGMPRKIWQVVNFTIQLFPCYIKANPLSNLDSLKIIFCSAYFFNSIAKEIAISRVLPAASKLKQSLT